MRKILLGSMLVTAAAVCAGPLVTDVRVTQTGNRDVTVTYSLQGEPAVTRSSANYSYKAHMQGFRLRAPAVAE